MGYSMKLKDYLAQFEGLDPEMDIYTGNLNASSYIAKTKPSQVKIVYLSKNPLTYCLKESEGDFNIPVYVLDSI